MREAVRQLIPVDFWNVEQGGKKGAIPDAFIEMKNWIIVYHI